MSRVIAHDTWVKVWNSLDACSELMNGPLFMSSNTIDFWNGDYALVHRQQQLVSRYPSLDITSQIELSLYGLCISYPEAQVEMLSIVRDQPSVYAPSEVQSVIFELIDKDGYTSWENTDEESEILKNHLADFIDGIPQLEPLMQIAFPVDTGQVPW